MIEFIEHTADIGIKVIAEKIEDIFKLSAYGMFKIICENLEDVECKEFVDGEIISDDILELLYLFLENLLFQFDTKALILKDFNIKLLDNKIVYSACGEFYNSKKHKIGTGIKSPTYHKMEIRKENGKYIAYIIFDI